MRYFVDTEFDWPLLLSLGIIAEDGRTFYRELALARVQPTRFLDEHVLPQLHGVVQPVDEYGGQLVCPTRDEHECPLVHETQLRQELLEFVAADQQPPEFWADYGAYDYVALCEILGGMARWPTAWPMYFNDIQQWARQLDVILPPIKIQNAPYGEHHALYDAMVCMAEWQMLQGMEQAIAQSVLKPALAHKLTKSGLALP